MVDSFNGVLPEDLPFVNKTLKNKDLQRIVAELIEKCGAAKVWPILDEIKRLGFHYATISGVSWGMDDLTIPPEKEKIFKKTEEKISQIQEQYNDGLLTDAERRARVIEDWDKAKAEISERVPNLLDQFGSVYAIIDSGARGSWSQSVHMMGMKGLVQNPKG